ncbi:RNA-splicing factor [Coemansia sp. RSA 2322]|nr:RNA-splicing factor [Coemansia sp. RSA 2322]
MSALKPGQADRGQRHSQYDREHIPCERPLDKGILEHERRRQVEVRCLELQDELETQGVLNDTDIAERVDKFRAQLLENIDQLALKNSRPIKSFETQRLAEAKSKENARLASALRVEEEYVEGAAFDRELQDLKRQRRMLEKELELERLREQEREREQKSRRRYRRSGRSRSPSSSSESESDKGRRRRDRHRSSRAHRRSKSESTSSESEGSGSDSSESTRRRYLSSRPNKGGHRRRKARQSASESGSSESESGRSSSPRADPRAVVDGEPGEIEDEELENTSAEPNLASTASKDGSPDSNARPGGCSPSDGESSDGAISE